MRKTKGRKLASIQYKIDVRDFNNLEEALDDIKQKVRFDEKRYDAIAGVSTIIVYYKLYRKNE